MAEDKRQRAGRPRRLPAGHVRRPRLHGRFERSPLTLICAPAGSGKSVLVREWLETVDTAQAYCCVGASEPSGTLMWATLAAAIAEQVPGFGDAVADVVQRRSRSDVAMALAFARDLDAVGERLVIVVEDVHRLGRRSHRELGALAEHMPDGIELVVTARVEPDFDLPLLRSRQVIGDIRSESLMFTPDEVGQCLAAAGFDADPATVVDLWSRTGGWPAAVGLAISAADPERPVAEPLRAGSNQPEVADFLRREVMRTLPDGARELLLATCILDELQPSLCDAVAGRTDSVALLGAIEASQCFVDRVEGDGSWYRCHHLLQEVLRDDLSNRTDLDVATLHGRAADWFDQHGRPLEAIEHAQRAGDPARTLDLLVRHMFFLNDHGHAATARSAAATIDTDDISDSGRLLDFAQALAFNGNAVALDVLDAVEHRSESDGEVVGHLALMRCIVAAFAGDLSGARQHLGDVRRHYGRTPACALGQRVRLNHARFLLLGGEHAEARRTVQSLANEPALADDYVGIVARGVLADIDLATGDLAAAGFHAGRSVAAWRARGLPVTAGAVDAFRVAAAVAIEQGDAADGRSLLEDALHVGGNTRPGAPRALALGAMARLDAREGRRSEALDHLEEITSWWVELPAGRELARSYYHDELTVHLRFREMTAARASLRSLEELYDTDGGPALGLARAAFAVSEGSTDRARQELRVTDLGGATVPQQLRHGVLAAAVELQAGSISAAAEALRPALRLGLPLGYRAIYRDLPRLTDILSIARQGERPSVQELVDQLVGQGVTLRAMSDLRESELRVLALLPTHLSYADMGRELYVSTNTIKSHIQSIYRKLGVDRRGAAVEAAREMGLLDAPG